MDVRLSRAVQSFSSEADFYVKIPDVNYTHRRYIFLVDMSHSMISGPCSGDVDAPGSIILQPTSSCPPLASLQIGQILPPNTYTGVDPDGVRLKVIQNWIEQLKQLPPELQATTQITIVPFSGGWREDERRVQEIGNGNGGKAVWQPLIMAGNYVSRLQSQQATDLQLAQDPEEWSQYMGTSVPVPRLQETYDLLRADMIQQAEAGVIGTTAYQFVYISDGVPVPTRTHFDRVLSASGCSNPASPFSCDALTQSLKVAWGDPDMNTLSAVKAQFDRMMSLTKFYGEADISFNLVVVRPDQILPSDRTDQANFLYGLKASSDRFQFTQLNTDQPPFVLKGLPRPFATYRVTALHAFNLNTRLNANGQIDIDSDGDGLFDSEEAALGTDPRNPRSNGVCLDSIAVNPAYKNICDSMSKAYKGGTLDCDPLLDIDQDGLNECEEQIIGSDAYSFDTDGDSIPDGLEIVYKTFPLKDDSQLDSNSDNVSNLINFQHGLSPLHYLGKVPEAFQVLLYKQFLGMATFDLGNGRTVDSERFTVTLTNAPISRGLAGVTMPELYSARSHKDEARIPYENLLVRGVNNSAVNEITYLARVVDVDDPTQSRWLILKRSVPIGTDSKMTIDLSEMTLLRTMDYNKKGGLN